jgi:hypothetical protein
MNQIVKNFSIRLLVCLLISLAFALIISETSFQLLKDENQRDPQEFILIIPAGTSERIEKGLPIPSIPVNMVFFEGDSIIVKNEDSISHQLGPIWVPEGAVGKIALEKPQKYNLACTFQPENKLGLDVKPRLTNEIRFQGVLAIGLPSSVLLWLFSIVIFPISKDMENEVNGE